MSCLWIVNSWKYKLLRGLNHLLNITIWYSCVRYLCLCYKMTYFFFLKSWFLFLLYPLFSSKNPFNFFGGGGCVFVCVCVCVGEGGLFYKFDGPREEGFNDSRWNPTGGRRWGVKKTQFWRGRLKCVAPWTFCYYIRNLGFISILSFYFTHRHSENI